MLETTSLKKTLGPVMLWGLGVGYVISGMYFGWNLGLEKGGTLGLGIAVFFISIMYITFTFSYTELACAIPKAGGGFDYAKKALGNQWGFLAGMAQNIEFIFAPPAIALAIGTYFNIFFPQIPVTVIAIIAYFVFTGINISGVKVAATFELLITIFAVVELLIFAGLTLPHFQWQHVTANSFPNGYQGIFAAIPFAIWFFLAIEGVANVAEETINPQKNVLIGFSTAITTIVVLAAITFLSAVGVAGWQAVVYKTDGSTSDSPLPMALGFIVKENALMYHLLVTVGLFGLVASFNGIILAAGRSTFEFGRTGFAPAFMGMVNKKFQTPSNALIVNMLIGIIALLTGKTGEIITIACFGALVLYIVSMVSLIQLRKNEPNLERPFKVPLYPLFPYTALSIAVVALIAISYFNIKLLIVFILLLTVSYLFAYNKLKER